MIHIDRRWEQNYLYEQLGFVFICNTEPRCFKFKINENKLNIFDESKTQLDELFDNGFWIIYDSGTKKYIKTINGFKKVEIIEREKNWGLANSIIDGVTKIVNEYGKIIVLEDDLVTSPYFLKFMNEALEVYKDEKNVYSITGYSFTDDIEYIDSSYFLSLTSSWSWATWSNKWEKFKRDKKDLENIVKGSNKEKKLFNFDNSYDYINMALFQKID